MKKILLVSAGNVFRGGVEIFLLTLVKYAPINQYSFVWYCPGIMQDEGLKKEFEEENVSLVIGNVPIQSTGIRSRVKRYRKICLDIRMLHKSYKFDIIHVNTGGVLFQTILAVYAHFLGIQGRIAHSHNALLGERKFVTIINWISSCCLTHHATKYVACSELAGAYLFGRKKAKEVLLMPNCIDVSKFAFSQDAREKIRSQFHLGRSFTIGHVGRFDAQKNHVFLIEIFRCIVKMDPTARLLLVGGGDLERKIREQVEQYHLTDKVIFAGVTDAVQDYLCAMDVFVLPSLYEGLGIVNIEAQASGLPCIVANTIPIEAKITNLIEFIALSSGTKVWSDSIIAYKACYDTLDRTKVYEIVENSPYNISYLPKYIDNLYQ